MQDPRTFVLHWHAAARLTAPRFVPDSWLRQAASLMEKGITPEDLTLVAKWMLTQLGRSQVGERNSVAFNAASFAWRKMFGEFGASDQHERFLEFLAAAESARPNGGGRRANSAPAQGPCGTPASAVNAEQEKRIRDEALRDFQMKMGGGPR